MTPCTEPSLLLDVFESERAELEGEKGGKQSKVLRRWKKDGGFKTTWKEFGAMVPKITDSKE